MFTICAVKWLAVIALPLTHLALIPGKWPRWLVHASHVQTCSYTLHSIQPTWQLKVCVGLAGSFQTYEDQSPVFPLLMPLDVYLLVYYPCVATWAHVEGMSCSLAALAHLTIKLWSCNWLSTHIAFSVTGVCRMGEGWEQSVVCGVAFIAPSHLCTCCGF